MGKDVYTYYTVPERFWNFAFFAMSTRVHYGSYGERGFDLSYSSDIHGSSVLAMDGHDRRDHRLHSISSDIR